MPDEQTTDDVPRSTISTAAAIDVVATLFNTQRRIGLAIRLCALALVLLFLGVVGSIYLGIHTSGRVTKVTKVVSRSPCSGLTSRECVRKLLGVATVKDLGRLKRLDPGLPRPPARPAPRRPRRTTSAPSSPPRLPATPASGPLDTPPRSPPRTRPTRPPSRPPRPAGPPGPPAPSPPPPQPSPRPLVDVPAPTVTTPAGPVTVPSACVRPLGGIGC